MGSERIQLERARRQLDSHAANFNDLLQQEKAATRSGSKYVSLSPCTGWLEGWLQVLGH